MGVLMTKLGDLFTEGVKDDKWDKTKNKFNTSIDELLAKNSLHSEVLLIMKELLQISKPVTMESYLED